MSGNSPKSMRIGLATENDKDHKAMKFCNCKRSNCLKLYCECFANGNYCRSARCNCNNCQNNSEYDAQRREAVEAILERNPNAFRSKILLTESSSDVQQSHHKGCHCKKSNCLKKYCECFQANVVCTSKCRCVACHNYTGSELRAEALLKAVATASGTKSGYYQREQAEAQAAKRRAIDRDESNRTMCRALIDKALEVRSAAETAPTSSDTHKPKTDMKDMKNAILDTFADNLKARVVQSIAVRMGPDIQIPNTTASKFPFTSVTSSSDYNPTIPSFPSITDTDFSFTQFADDSLSKKLRASMEKDGGMFDLSNPLTTLIQPNDENKQHFEVLPSIVRSQNAAVDTSLQDTDGRTTYWQPSPTEQQMQTYEL